MSFEFTLKWAIVYFHLTISYGLIIRGREIDPLMRFAEVLLTIDARGWQWRFNYPKI